MHIQFVTHFSSKKSDNYDVYEPDVEVLVHLLHEPDVEVLGHLLHEPDSEVLGHLGHET